MKILMLTSEFPPFRGGVSTYAYELAMAAAGAGHEVTVAAPAYHADQSAGDAQHPFRVIRFPGGPNRAKDIMAKARWTRRHAAEADYDVVHAIDWPFFVPLAVSRFRRQARCILTFHGTEVNMMRRPSRARLLGLLRFWSGWAEYVANSHFTGDYLADKFPRVRRDTVRAIPLGVRAPADIGPVEREAARQQIGREPGDFVLVSLGRMVERKGLHVTAAALSLLPEDVQSHLVWYVVGPENDPAYAQSIKDRVAGLAVRTVFTGGIGAQELEAHLSAADLFCLPAVWGKGGEFEGFGLVYLEAGLRGVPSVASRLGGVPDAVLDGESGLLVEPSNAAELAEAITQLYRDPELRARMGVAARSHANALTWERVAVETYA